MKRKIFALGIGLAAAFASPAQDTLSLMDAIRIGLENNYAIRIQKNEQQIAGNNNTLGNAGMLPSLDLEVSPDMSVSTSNSQYINNTEKNVSSAQNTSFAAGLELSWTLFDGFRIFAAKNTFEQLEQMGEIQSRMVIENTVSSIIQTYYGIVQQKKLIQVQADAVGLSVERKKLAAARIQIGAGSRMMLLQSTVDLNADSAKLLNEIAGYKNLKADLNRTIGRLPETNFEVEESLEIDESLIYENLLENLLVNNADILISQGKQRIASLALTDARSERYPTIDLDAAYNFNRSTSQSGFLEYNRAYGPSAGLTLSYNLFNGLNTGRNIRNAKLDMGSADWQNKDTELDLRTQLYKMFEEYNLNRSLIKLETANSDVARTNVEVALEKYKLGAISDIELREIQNKYIDAQYQLVFSQYRAKNAETGLFKMSGQLYNKIFR